MLDIKCGCLSAPVRLSQQRPHNPPDCHNTFASTNQRCLIFIKRHESVYKDKTKTNYAYDKGKVRESELS